MSDDNNKGKPGPITGLKVSRMDPMETYDAGALAVQLAEALKNEIQFRSDAKEYLAQAEREKKKAEDLKVLIEKVNERDRKRAAAAEETG